MQKSYGQLSTAENKMKDRKNEIKWNSATLHWMGDSIVCQIYIYNYTYNQFMADKSLIEIIHCWKHWSWLVHMVILFAFSLRQSMLIKQAAAMSAAAAASLATTTTAAAFSFVRIVRIKLRERENLYAHECAHGSTETQQNTHATHTLHETSYIVNKCIGMPLSVSVWNPFEFYAHTHTHIIYWHLHILL